MICEKCVIKDHTLLSPWSHAGPDFIPIPFAINKVSAMWRTSKPVSWSLIGLNFHCSLAQAPGCHSKEVPREDCTARNTQMLIQVPSHLTDPRVIIRKMPEFSLDIMEMSFPKQAVHPNHLCHLYHLYGSFLCTNCHLFDPCCNSNHTPDTTYLAAKKPGCPEVAKERVTGILIFLG